MPLSSRLSLEADFVVRRWRARLWPRSYQKRRLLRDHLQKLFELQRVDCVFDIGANRGQYYRFLRHELGFTGLIVSCEPIASLAAELQRRATVDSQWRVFDCALGATAGEASINVMDTTVYSSMLTPDSTHALAGEGNTIARTEQIRVRTFADLFAELEGQHPMQRAYLKLDTQGFDLEVLRGTGAALARVTALQTELSFVPIYHGMPDWQTMLIEVKQRGFDVSGFFPVTHDAALRLIEADAVCIRATERAS